MSSAPAYRPRIPKMYEVYLPTPCVRRIDCAHQNHCLSRADEKGWRGMGCYDDCPVYSPMTAAEHKHDEEALLELAYHLNPNTPLRRERVLK